MTDCQPFKSRENNINRRIITGIHISAVSWLSNIHHDNALLFRLNSMKCSYA